MIDVPILTLLSELGFKPMEVVILLMLWQNIKSTRSLLNRLVVRVKNIELIDKEKQQN